MDEGGFQRSQPRRARTGRGEHPVDHPPRLRGCDLVGGRLDRAPPRSRRVQDRLLGSSLGGYYAPRAAAREPRIRATVANCGPYDWSECWEGLPVVTREAFTHYSGSANADEARAKATEYTLAGVLGSRERPLLVAHGSVDPLIPWEQGRRIVDDAGTHGEFLLVEGGNHGINNLSYRWVPYARDWLVGNVMA